MTAKQTPLGINVNSGFLQNIGLQINPKVPTYVGVSKSNSDFVPGKIINDTCLLPLTYAINDAYNRSAKNAVAEWHHVTNAAWSSFMNNYAIWSGPDTEITTRSRYVTVNFPATGMYTFAMQADNYMNVIIDYDTPIAIGIKSFTDTTTVVTRVTAGNHTISMIITNDQSGGPAGGALTITGNSLNWNSNTSLPSATNGATVSNANYDKLLSIGRGVIPALGNSPSYTWTNYDPSNKWWGTACSTYYLTQDPSYAQGQSQTATWLPWNVSNTNKSVTQWGYFRLFPLQAWNEFNYNGEPTGSDMPQYQGFCASFLSCESYLNFTNVGINSFDKGPDFLQGVYSNMNDLSSGDITNVTLATKDFGQDCITLGRVIDLSKIEKFGLPSVLLQTIKKNKILTQSLSLALLAAGLTQNEVTDIAAELINPVSKLQEQKIYGAFLIIKGKDLEEILFALNCKTQGLETLADLLNLKKIFPNSYLALTVPIYNADPGPTNSKTYYPIFDGTSVSARIQSSQVKEQVGSTIPVGPPPIVEPVLPKTIYRKQGEL